MLFSIVYIIKVIRDQNKIHHPPPPQIEKSAQKRKSFINLSLTVKIQKKHGYNKHMHNAHTDTYITHTAERKRERVRQKIKGRDRQQKPASSLLKNMRERAREKPTKIPAKQRQR